MNYRIGILTACLACCLACTAACEAEDPAEVAGRTLDQYVEMLDSPDRVVRLRAARSLAPFGKAAGDALTSSLDHEDAAMRYVAAESLGRIGGTPLELAVGRLCELAEDETSHAVRMAASFALCRNGLNRDHLPFLIESLDYPERGISCTAAYLIGEVGPSAKQAVPALNKTYEKNGTGVKGGDYHLGGSALNALRKLGHTPEGK